MWCNKNLRCSQKKGAKNFYLSLSEVISHEKLSGRHINFERYQNGFFPRYVLVISSSASAVAVYRYCQFLMKIKRFQSTWRYTVTKWQAFRRKTSRCKSFLLCWCQVVFKTGASFAEPMPGGRFVRVVPKSAGQVPRASQSIPIILSSFTCIQDLKGCRHCPIHCILRSWLFTLLHAEARVRSGQEICSRLVDPLRAGLTQSWSQAPPTWHCILNCSELHVYILGVWWYLSLHARLRYLWSGLFKYC